MIDTALNDVLVGRFADAVMADANLPKARRRDVEESASFAVTSDEITCVCAITGSTYTESWDGSAETAVAFAASVGSSTAQLVRATPKNRHYAWLYAKR